MSTDTYKPALIVVDVQEDFLPPSGSLAVKDGREVIPIINELIKLPCWSTVIASLDWHPRDHVSFASNHGLQPFTTKTLPPPSSSVEKEPREFMLWPDHCVQDTPGAQLTDELNQERISHIVKKGTLSTSEYYSGFQDTWGIDHTNMEDILRQSKATDVYVVGLAFDYCVFHTAIDAAAKGFNTFIIREATKAVNSENDSQTIHELEKRHVKVISLNGPELAHLLSKSDTT
ncbi:nicotinamidase [Sugiyamaella lignohabitans]|uniref:nicotinamidase n=1 Tax=Sugiyamaella lignohabitans TaxID=796027 RepID=A0A167CAQ1_9ASCO|nr:nicotinamidase [Sugiyamaella lignohabitans]ANB11436.1 nicotinamidase [Sugiyamaella lignohabitans]